MKRLVYLVGVVVVWMLAWGSVSVANILSGVAIGVLVAAVIPEREMLTGRISLRPGPLMRLGGFFLSTAVKSNVELVRLTFGRRVFPPAGVIETTIPPLSDVELTLVTSLIALSPGSITVDVRRDPWVLSVHFLDISDPEAQRTWLDQLVERCQAVAGARP